MQDDHTVPAGGDLVLIGSTFVHHKIDEECRSSRLDGSLDAKDFSSDDFHSHFVIFVGWNLIGLELLILWLTIFTRFVKIKPKLESISWNIEACRHLSMNDTFTSGHPLDIAWTKSASIPLEVFVADFA